MQSADTTQSRFRMQKMGKAKRARERGIQRRSALSPKNIVEFAMAQSAKQQKRNRSMKTSVLTTSPGLLGRVVCVAPNQGTVNEL